MEPEVREPLPDTGAAILKLWDERCNTETIRMLLHMPQHAVERQLHAALAWRRAARGGVQ